LLNNVALIVIVTFAALTILNLFVQIGPLLAVSAWPVWPFLSAPSPS
jgi:hypothetical protein